MDSHDDSHDRSHDSSRDDLRGGTRGAVVAQVAVFPLKGAAAADTATIRIDADGVVGDRRHAVVDADGEVITAERAPHLRDVCAGLDDDGTLVLDIPGEGDGLRGADADAALTRFLGRPVRVTSVPPGSQLDAPVHLVSTQAVAHALSGRHEVADCACSLEEPRANLVIRFGAESDRAESDRAESDRAGSDLEETDLEETDLEDTWVGGELAAGEVRLRVQRRPGHCLGVYADVVVPGRVEAGAPVVVVG